MKLKLIPFNAFKGHYFSLLFQLKLCLAQIVDYKPKWGLEYQFGYNIMLTVY